MELKVIAKSIERDLEELRGAFNELITCVNPLKNLSDAIDAEWEKTNKEPAATVMLARKLMADKSLLKKTLEEFNSINSGAETMKSINVCMRFMMDVQRMEAKLKLQHLIPSPTAFLSLAAGLNDELKNLETILDSDEANKNISKVRAKLIDISTLLTKVLIGRK